MRLLTGVNLLVKEDQTIRGAYRWMGCSITQFWQLVKLTIHVPLLPLHKSVVLGSEG